jgi:hypothetical protein
MIPDDPSNIARLFRSECGAPYIGYLVPDLPDFTKCLGIRTLAACTASCCDLPNVLAGKAEL